MKYWVIKAVGLLLLNTTAIAQIHCAEAAAKQLPWRLRPETSRGDWAQYMRPVMTEMQRLFPQPLPGLELTYGLYGTKGPFINRPGAREYYEAFFMIKDIVCERQNDGSRKVIPEGETGCWIYYRANDIGQLLHTHLGGTGYTLPGTDWPLYMGDLRVSENENGLASIYTYGDKDEYQFAGWYISPRKQLPVRAITKKEWALAYRHYWLTKWAADNKRLEGLLLSSKAGYQRTLDDNTLAADQKQQLLKSYTTGDADTRNIIARNRQQAIECRQLTEEMLLAPDVNEPAKVSAVNGLLFEPARMRRTEGKLYHIYVQDMTVFNGTLPAAQPQYIIAYLRRQDITPAKTAFIKRVEEAFDWNVVRRMTGVSPLAQPITISGMGNSPGGYTSGPLPEGSAPTAPTLSVGSSVAGAYFSEDFAATTVGQPPVQWTVSNGSAIVQEINGSKCLTLKEPGLFFPGYAILQLPQNFTLSFDLGWNKDISYYSPDFMVHIGAARYDNTLKRYDRKQVDANAYTSAAMERTCLWIDPHWNDIGYCGWEVFDKNGGYLRKESFRTPQFYRERNTVAVKLVRQGSQLKVYFNDELIKEVADMQPNIRWNFFGFGLSNAPNAAPTDEFYLRNIRLSQ